MSSNDLTVGAKGVGSERSARRHIVRSDQRRSLALVGFAIVVPVLATAVGLAAGLDGRPGQPMVYVVAILIVSMVAGWEFSILSTAVAAPTLLYFFAEPVGSFVPAGDGWILIVAFLLGAVATNAAVFLLRRERDLSLTLARERDLASLRLEQTLVGTGTGRWEWLIGSDDVAWSSNLGPLHGLAEGYQPKAIDGWREVVHPDDRPGLELAIESALAGNDGYEAEFRTLLPNGEARWLWTHARVIRDDTGAPERLVGLTRDVDELRRARDREALLARLSERIAGTSTVEQAASVLSDVLVPDVCDVCLVQRVNAGNLTTVVAAKHRDGSMLPTLLERLERLGRAPGAEARDHPLAQTIQQRRGRLHRWPRVEEGAAGLSTGDERTAALMQELGIGASVIVPIAAGDRVLALLELGYTVEREPPRGADLAFAEKCALRAVGSFARAEVYEREHAIAVTLQQSLLPSDLPTASAYDLGAAYLPGDDAADVGGDWYDAFSLPDGSVCLAIGDAVGKGVAAASVMARLATAVRAYALEGHQPAMILDRLDQLLELHAGPEGSFATTAIVIFDPRTRNCAYASAGHLPILLLPVDDAPRWLDHGQTLPLGMNVKGRVSGARFELEPGDALVLYTDGLVERRGASIDDGLAHLAEVAEVAGRIDGVSAARTVDLLVEGCIGPTRQREDDVALLVMQAR